MAHYTYETDIYLIKLAIGTKLNIRLSMIYIYLSIVGMHKA